MGEIKSLNYYRGFDGLRFFSILSVIIYHYLPHILSGGFLGVDAFLVLSGFLLGTSLLKLEKQGFRYGNYLIKRFVRLVVPLLAMLVISVVFFMIFQFKFLYNFKQTFWSSLLFINNYVQISGGSSYFEVFVNPSPYVHLWYLGVQMQLYILTPIIFFIGKKVFKSKQKLGGLFFVLALISAIWMAVAYPLDGDPSRVYYGTDTRAFTFFIGMAVSLLNENIYKFVKKIFSKNILMLAFFSIILIFMAVMIFFLEDRATLTYRGGMVTFDILVGLAIVFISNFKVAENILGFKLLSKLGRFSFSTYLWYYPVFTYFTYGSLAATWLGKRWYLQVIGLFLLSFIFYLVFEKELTDKILKIKSLRELVREPRTFFAKDKRIKNVVVTALTLVAIVGLVISPSGKNETVEQLEERLAEEQRKIAEAKLQEKLESEKDIPDIEGLDRAIMLFSREEKITFFGDSILLSGASGISEVFPSSNIDGAVGRQLYNSPPLIEKLKVSNKLNKNVVVILGTNGSFTESQFEKLIDSIGKERNIIFITVSVDRSWEDDVNDTMKKYAKNNDHIYLFDWREELKKHPEWLEPDNVHLNRKGSKGLAKFIAENYYEVFDDTHKEIEDAKSREEKIKSRFKKD